MFTPGISSKNALINSSLKQRKGRREGRGGKGRDDGKRRRNAKKEGNRTGEEDVVSMAVGVMLTAVVGTRGRKKSTSKILESLKNGESR